MRCFWAGAATSSATFPAPCTSRNGLARPASRRCWNQGLNASAARAIKRTDDERGAFVSLRSRGLGGPARYDLVLNMDKLTVTLALAPCSTWSLPGNLRGLRRRHPTLACWPWPAGRGCGDERLGHGFAVRCRVRDRAWKDPCEWTVETEGTKPAKTSCDR